MPRPNPPPTPGSSSDIRGKEADLLAPAFDLPPTAYCPEQDRASSNSSVVSSANGSDSSYRPASSGVAGESRKRSAPHPGPVITTDDFTLPPPPTRSRKIIQMRPRGPAQHDPSPAQSSQGVARTQTAGTQGGKRKQNATGQTAAGRKIARKTAHSLIERRRRSKMNEEFGVLKEMIPACQGQEMHKLAILQASIEYLRYLEQCISDLQAQTHSSPSLPPPSARSTRNMHNDDEMDDNDDDEDEEMPDQESEGEKEESQPTATAAPTRANSLISLPSLSQLYPANPTSPPIFPQSDTTPSARHFSISSASQPSYSPYIHSHHASPAFGPQLPLYHPPPPPPQATANHQGNNHFGLGSPALKPLDSSSPSLEDQKNAKYGSIKGSSTSSNDNPTRLQPQRNQRNPPSPPTPTAAPSPSLEQDATSAAAMALSMLNSSTTASRPAPSTSSPFFSQRRRSLDPPRQEAEGGTRERDADIWAGRVPGNCRPLPRSCCFPASGCRVERGEDGWAVGPSQQQWRGGWGSESFGPSEGLGAGESGRGGGRGRRLDGDDAGNGSGSGGGGIGGGVGGGISVRDLLSS
ncbi:hypothetical protein KC322_g6143 [Hortaea werneckii]|nr:hypothetical protein KC320_g9085 [Hortaea werneckii]KAI7705765.1 hypothetical protein KC322_g6143 [Hortaea werneckii]